MEWIKKNREVVITLAVFSLFGLLLLIWTIFFRTDDSHRNNKEADQKPTYTVPREQQTQSSSKNNGKQQKTEIKSYLLRPTPGELLDKLEGLTYQEFSEQTAKLPGLKVMWPAYFFSVVEVKNNQADVMLDVSEDGFGALILAHIPTDRFPRVLTLERRDKVWLAGEIIGVDPSGTGQFEIKVDQVRFDDFQPFKGGSPSPKDS